MKIVACIIAFGAAVTGVIATLDWEERTAELVRWCLCYLFVVVMLLFLTGCAEVRTLYHTCKDGLCR